MSYMTRLPGVPDTDDIKPGMAFYMEERQFKTMACKKFRELSGRHGLPVKADWAACKYWEGKP